MTTPAVQTEYIARALESVLNTHLRAALDGVEAAWATIDPMVLPSPALVSFGFEEVILNLPVSAFPRVAILAAPVEPSSPGGDQRVTQATHTVMIEWLVLAKGSRAATIHSWRYGHALAEVIRSHGPYAGFSPLSIVPSIQEGQAMVHIGPQEQALRNRQQSDQHTNYVAGGILTYPMRGKYTA